MKELLTIIADIGLGGCALYLASQLTKAVKTLQAGHANHEVRITVLEKKAA